MPPPKEEKETLIFPHLYVVEGAIKNSLNYLVWSISRPHLRRGLALYLGGRNVAQKDQEESGQALMGILISLLILDHILFAQSHFYTVVHVMIMLRQLSLHKNSKRQGSFWTTEQERFLEYDAPEDIRSCAPSSIPCPMNPFIYIFYKIRYNKLINVFPWVLWAAWAN